ADRRVVVRVLTERRGERVLVEHLEGRVLAPLELVAHDGHLGHPVLVAQQRVAHARGLDPDRDFELVGRNRLVVVRPVEPGRRVEPRPEGVEHRGHGGPFRAVELGRAFEHEVLEQVRRARVAHRFVAAADVVDDGERHDRGDPVLEQEDGEAVGAETVLAKPGLLPNELEGTLGQTLYLPPAMSSAPSTPMTLPETHAPPAPLRDTRARATSAGVVRRPAGWSASVRSIMPALPGILRRAGVSVT